MSLIVRCGPRIGTVLMIALLSACGGNPTSDSVRDFAQIKDSGPQGDMDVSHIPDAIPRPETRTLAGNKNPYTVLGKTYHLLQNGDNYSEQGLASWYGEKFHGRNTSNGEVYDMYAMTAAHKTLLIPAYVRVTNLENNRQVVVRVNDRGPFHEGRIIDLSYTAATKLGFAKRGTARVQVDVINPMTNHSSKAKHRLVSNTTVSATRSTTSSSGLPKVPTPKSVAGYQLPENTFLQAGAFSSQQAALSTQLKISALTQLPVFIIDSSADDFFRVRIGPVSDNLVVMNLRQILTTNNLPNPHVVYE